MHGHMKRMNSLYVQAWIGFRSLRIIQYTSELLVLPGRSLRTVAIEVTSEASPQRPTTNIEPHEKQGTFVAYRVSRVGAPGEDGVRQEFAYSWRWCS